MLNKPPVIATPSPVILRRSRRISPMTGSMKQSHFRLPEKFKYAPKYIKLKEMLREQIEKGVFKPGSKIPTEFELTKKYNISRTTAIRSINDLVNDGFLYRIQGKGTFVANPMNRSRPNASIALVMSYINDAFTGDIIRGIESTAKGNGKGYSLIFCNSGDELKKEEEYIQKLIDEVSGFIIFPTDSYSNYNIFQMLMHKKVPFILIDRYLKKIKTDYVVVDNFKGGYIATKHLIESGYKRIAHITALNPECRTSEESRLKGYRKALSESGMEFDKELVEFFKPVGDPSKIDCRKPIKKLLQLKNRPTAIFCLHDLVAVAAIKALEEKGLKVPENIAIVGFDNIHIAEVVGLTTVSQPRYELGKKAAKLLMEKIGGKRKSLCQVVLQPELIIRRSSGAKKEMEVMGS